MLIPQSRDEHWTGLGLVWIRPIANFVEFGLNPDNKTLQNLGSGLDSDWVNGKEMRHFCCEKVAFFKYFGLHLDLELTFENILDGSWTWTEFLKTGLDLDRKIWQSAHLCRWDHGSRSAGVESNRRLRFFLESELNAESEFWIKIGAGTGVKFSVFAGVGL